MWRRLYSCLFAPPRFDLYCSLLVEAEHRGYVAHSVRSFWQLIKNGEIDERGRYLILRHDVDSDTAAAEIMWALEQSHGARASYYFRLATVDVALMQRIEFSGSEASYHYEEAAAFAKARCCRTPEQVRRAMPRVRDQFRANLRYLRKATGLPMVTVASHGDFVNRKLKVYNGEILEDQALRQELGIDLEVYDEVMKQHVTSRHCDRPHPQVWAQQDPIDAVREGKRAIYVLTHPGHWQSNPRERLLSGVRRLQEGVSYSLGRRCGPWPLALPTLPGDAACGSALELSAKTNSEGASR